MFEHMIYLPTTLRMYSTLAILISALLFFGIISAQTNTTSSPSFKAIYKRVISKRKAATKANTTSFVASEHHVKTFFAPPSVPKILPANCTGKLSCAGRCTTEVNFQDIGNMPNPSCFCDRLCDSVFQDCCADYDQECNATWMREKLPERELDNHWECSSVTYGADKVKIWMISSCGLDWAEDNVWRRCNKHEDFEEISTYIPVIDTNNITYRNRYCAKCNNINVFTQWRYDVECDVVPPAEYTEQESMAFGDRFCEVTSLTFSLGEQLFRYCIMKEVTCLYKDDKAAVEGCQMGPTGLVAFLTPIIIYRNLDCLRCSLKDKSNKSLMCGPRIYQEHVVNPIDSFSSIFKVSKLEHNIYIQCPHGQIFDKVSRVCKKLVGKQEFTSGKLFQRYAIVLQYDEKYNSCRRSIMKVGREKNRLIFAEVFEQLLDIRLIESESWQFTDLDVQVLRNFSYSVTFQVFGKMDGDIIPPLQYSKIGTITFRFKLVVDGACSYSLTYTAVRAMFCAENNTYSINEDDFQENKTIFLNKTKQYYYHGQYLVYDEQNETRLAVCKDYRPANCSYYLEVKKKTWEMFPNRSLYSNVTASLFNYGEYAIINGTLRLCLTKNHLGIPKELWANPSSIHRVVLGLMSYISFIISIISLLVLLMVYSVFPSLRNLPGKNLMLLCGVIVLCQLLWLLKSATHYLSSTLCVAISIALQYLYLSTLCCSSSIAFHSFITFHSIAKGKLRQSGDSSKTFLWYAMFALGFPLVVVTVFWLLDFFKVLSLVYAGRLCWFADQRSIYIAFIAPLYTILFVNIILFLATLRLIYKCTKESQKLFEKNCGANKQHVGIYLRMSTLSGLTWIFGVFVILFPEVIVFDYLFILTNGAQGFYIAVAFLFTESVKKHLSRKLGRSSATSAIRSSGTKLSVNSIA